MFKNLFDIAFFNIFLCGIQKALPSSRTFLLAKYNNFLLLLLSRLGNGEYNVMYSYIEQFT